MAGKGGWMGGRRPKTWLDRDLVTLEVPRRLRKDIRRIALAVDKGEIEMSAFLALLNQPAKTSK